MKIKIFRNFFFRLFSLQFAALLLVVSVTLVLTVNSISDLMYRKTADELENICKLVCNTLPSEKIISLYDIEAYALYATSGTGIRLTIIQYSGSILADSHANYRSMSNHFNRPEVMEAFTKNIGRSIRYSETMGTEMMFVAVSYPSMGFVIRTSKPVEEITHFRNFFYKQVIPYTVFVFFMILIFAFFFSAGIHSNIKSLKDVTHHYATGDFSVFLPERDDELGDLNHSINVMGSHLKNRIDLITAKRDQIQAIVSRMINPVVLVDDHLNVLEINPAAANLTDNSQYVGKNISDVILNEDINHIIRITLEKKQDQESAVCFDPVKGIYYFVHTTYIKGISTLSGTGTILVVMNDISGMKRLDDMRREFSANASHELKTPVTSIMGYVDTLIETYREHPENIGRFLGIIKKQSDRLARIIEDLLILSRTDSTYIRLEKEHMMADELIAVSVSNVSEMAAEKNITIECGDFSHISMFVHPVLAEQALSNLLNNAVKYSDSGTTVTITAAETDGFTEISVSDNGPGIEPEYLPRLFERFYRVNKEISRTLGGTGLGLSIVKQVAVTHGGKVEVESVVGKGSVFKIYFPA